MTTTTFPTNQRETTHMTTTVNIESHPGAGKEVRIRTFNHEGGTALEDVTISDGEVAVRYIHDDNVLVVNEQAKPTV